MKKLVESAKEQFEKAIIGNCLYNKYGDCDCYMHEKDGKAVIYCADKSYGLYQYKVYDKSWEEMCSDIMFVVSIIFHHLNGGEEHIPDILYWWCNDRNKMNMPFSMGSIFDSDYEQHYDGIYEDIYEEIPDIVSAKEQWEKDSADAVECIDTGVETYKAYVEDGRITFYVRKENEYLKYKTLDYQELCKSPSFITKYFDVVLQNHPEDINAASMWINTGKYTMSDCSLLDILEAVGASATYDVYKDKPNLENEIKLNPEQQQAAEEIKKAIQKFKECGGMIIYDDGIQELKLVNQKNLKYENDYYCKFEDEGFFDISDLAVFYNLCEIDMYWGSDDYLYCKRNNE